MDVPFLDVSYKQNHETCGLLCLVSFTHCVFKVCPRCGMCQSILPFPGQVMTRGPRFVYPFICWWPCGLFPPSGDCMNDAAVGVHVQVFECLLPGTWGRYLEMQLPGHR